VYTGSLKESVKASQQLMMEQTTVDLTLDISSDKIDQIRQSATRAATKGALSGDTPTVMDPKDRCITPILKSKPKPTCSTLKLSDCKGKYIRR
jgi:hypothetical protein